MYTYLSLTYLDPLRILEDFDMVIVGWLASQRECDMLEVPLLLHYIIKANKRSCTRQ